ncbi:bifunctional adenosylcobinamide kinase/adenosylcobinamide-phosphate guanylyltransferase [Ferrimonas senticii]|uniref:bifunctional adenosylcobinamide kinase/adenosylcobinamide-phosphate guanylyltransferase n=1 Tax=Ferrimonas senticii TaxID=394566 RepID=UPI000416980A|nr:bifunctional adenosylcobinamide kinase/adenosylcobinamide-phosphate guanylyltransferase [Ferrimonas senticii]
MLALYLGGARSGKSALAEAAAIEAEQQGMKVVYVATATPSRSMAARIALHQQRRPLTWRCVEEPLALAQLLTEANANAVILVDCLTLWLTNQLLADADLALEQQRLLTALAVTPASVLLVTTEVGHSLIPDDPLSQAFVVAAGELHQAIAALADQVHWCVGGFATELKAGSDQR